MQKVFNPLDYGFKWAGDWYEFDHKSASSAALKARNAEAKRLEKEGKRVRKWSLPNQLISRGGIGSHHPHIQEIVTVYGLSAD